MKRIPVARHALDLAISRRIFNTSWLSASFGLSILEMLLLAQGWRINQQALAPALLASAWALGSLLGMRLSGPPRLWGYACFACTLLWLGSQVLVAWRIPRTLLPSGLQDMAILALLAVLLGASSAAWLAKPRAWPQAGERIVLVRGLVSLTIGLLVAWMLPASGGLIALACCLPLLVLDVLLSGRAPLHSPGSVADLWQGRYWNVEQYPMQLEKRGSFQSRRTLFQRSRLESARGTLPLSLLASAVAVVLGSVWGAIPTPFAASLHAAHRLDVLSWLLGGQIIALAVGICCLFAARSVIGFPDRLLPAHWQSRLRKLSLLMPLAMAASLAALGVPMLQARWWLALSLAGYTLADAVWSILLPRLVPDLATVVQSQRHLLLEQHAGLADPLHLAYARACENHAKLRLARAEGLTIMVCTPLLGWLIDRLGSADAVLVIVGLVFALSVACAALVWALITFIQRLPPSRLAPRRQGWRFSGSTFPMMEVAPHR